jgi:hypothetical protein
LAPGTLSAKSDFHFTEVTTNSLGIWEGASPVLVYNHGIISKAGVPADRARSSYIHPLYGLDGEVLTDDFPADHFHHRGLFWAWPHVKVGDQEFDLWMLKGIRHQFTRWLARDTGSNSAVLAVQNGWFVGDKKVVDEKMWLRAWPATAEGRALDIEFEWVPLEKSMTLRGAEGKSYGGLTLRFAPRKETVITTPQGSGKEDLSIAHLPWADLSAQFAGASQPSGAAIFIHPTHPDYPPEWLTRHYGVLCLGWPGVADKTFAPGETIRCRYRVWIHRGAPSAATVKRVYEDYIRSSSNTAPVAPQKLRAKAESDRVRIEINGSLFTEYLFTNGEKYPYFYPVNGPRTGKSVTERRLESYPHHSSIFFGCDKVNGGDYWQEGLERGRIVSKEVRLLHDAGEEIVFEQTCRWERPGAEPPFDDVRTIRVNAPSADLRCIDFDIRLTARIKVRIEKTNHSLFSVRMAPDLATKNGGKLINANGDETEQGTFGHPSPWADFRGSRGTEIEGISVLCHPSNKWFPSPWFTRDYGFMSPTPLYWPENGFVEFQPGETIRLRYRVLIHAGNPSSNQIQAEFLSWSKTAS